MSDAPSATRAAPVLAPLRVLELASGVAGPYAGRLLAMLGATVVKVEPPGGDRARRQPIDDGPTLGPSPLFVHLNAGNQLVELRHADLDQLVGWADVVLDDRVRHEVAGSRVDPGKLRAHGRAIVLVSITAWGFDAEGSGSTDDELLVQAVSGALTLTGDPGGPPLRLPGWQSQYLAGAYGATAALAARRVGRTVHLDVSWCACMATGAEGSFQTHLSTGYQAPPAGPRPLQAYPGGATPCADGHVVPGTIRRSDWEAQCELYGRPDLAADERFAARGARGTNWQALWEEIRPWYEKHTRDEIFNAGLERGWAVGMVLSASDALTDPHLRARGFLGSLAVDDVEAVGPVAPFGLRTVTVTHGQAARRPAPRAVPRPARSDPATWLANVRVLELTTAWAGPFVGRLLGALGADVVKVESARAFDIWRGPFPYKLMMRTPPEGVDRNDLSHDIAANFNGLNRNKRGIALDLAHPGGRETFLALVPEADVVVANFARRVLPELAVDEPVLRRARPDLVFLNMPALGATGPYRDAAGYGSITEGMGGVAARFGHPEEGARVSQTFYPDPVAGIHGAFAVLAGLAHRDATGEGVSIDLSQQETLWLMLGEGIALASMAGRDPSRMGNAEPGRPGSGIEAVDEQWIATNGHAREPVLPSWEAKADPRLQWLLEPVDHPVTGRLPHLRLPFRFDGRPLDTTRPSPRFGAHTVEVLGEWLGLDAGRIAALEAEDAAGGVSTTTGVL